MRTLCAAAEGQPPRRAGQQNGRQQQQGSARQRRPAYSPAVPRKPSDVGKDVDNLQGCEPQITPDGPLLEPVQQVVDDPLEWEKQQQSPPQPVAGGSTVAPATGPSGPVVRNLFRLPRGAKAAVAPPGNSSSQQQQGSLRAAAHAPTPGQVGGHKHPPIAPEDPAELLKVLQVMDPPRRRLVIFKGGGYVYSDMEAMIQSAGLSHVMRLTNLVRKAHCIVAKERRDTGKRVNLEEHRAAARNANIPFLLIDRLEPEQLLALLRPLLVRKRIVAEHPQAKKAARDESPTAELPEQGGLG